MIVEGEAIMGRFIYNLLLPLGFVFFLPELILKYRNRGGWKNTFGERFARYGARQQELAGYKGAIWVHAVSVGETVVALSMIRRYLQRYPERKFIVSTTTTTGQEVARANAPDNTTVIFCPIDFSWMVKKALNLMQPSALVVFETEIWPNLISLASARKIPVMLVNARMSDHSAKGYRRLGKLFFDPLLRKFTRILVQTEVDAERFLSVSPRAQVSVVGNMKFDQKLPELPESNILHNYFDRQPDNLIILGASTHPGEELLFTECFLTLRDEFPGLKLVLVPRHAERGGDIATMLQEKKVSFVRRSQVTSPDEYVDVLLADTTGEMLRLMSGADVVIMGKSFAGHDEGHNLLEPALLRKAIVTGTVLRNFRYIFNELNEHDALIPAADNELSGALRKLLSSAEFRKELGERAFEVVDANRGAADKTIDALESAWKDTGK